MVLGNNIYHFIPSTKSINSYCCLCDLLGMEKGNQKGGFEHQAEMFLKCLFHIFKCHFYENGAHLDNWQTSSLVLSAFCWVKICFDIKVKDNFFKWVKITYAYSWHGLNQAGRSGVFPSPTRISVISFSSSPLGVCIQVTHLHSLPGGS